ncbi:hypothetical protein M5689_003350 [Euphorbia peplus]|nr:hypothetical protein M5689_003350 [Euphorbia peplus]
MDFTVVHSITPNEIFVKLVHFVQSAIREQISLHNVIRGSGSDRVNESDPSGQRKGISFPRAEFCPVSINRFEESGSIDFVMEERNASIFTQALSQRNITGTTQVTREGLGNILRDTKLRLTQINLLT